MVKIGGGYQLPDGFGDRQQILFLDGGATNQKFFTTPAGDEIAAAYGLVKCRGQRLQHGIPRIVPILVIYQFEVIDVEHDDAETLTVTFEAREFLVQNLVHVGAIG